MASTTERDGVPAARPPLRFLLEYGAVLVLDASLRLLSWESAQAAGAFMGGAARLLLRRRWAMTRANLAAAFPGKSADWVWETALEAWRNAGRIAAEFIRARHLSRAELERLVRFENLDLVEKTYGEGKGIVFNIGHLGNWEVGGLAFTARGLPLGVVGRVMRNPLLDRWLNESRSRFGGAVFSHRNPFFQVVRWLKAGKGTAILIDHNLHQGGIFVPFFGRPAATSTLSGLLAVKLRSPVLSVRVFRDGPGLVVRFEGPLRAAPGADPEAEAERLTLEMTRTIEGFVRERPGEWLWGHNRWKRSHEAGASPPAENSLRLPGGALPPRSRKYRIVLSGRLHRLDADTVAREAAEHPGVYELIVTGGGGKPRVAFVGVAMESIRASLERHIAGALKPRLETLCGLSAGGEAFFEFVAGSDIDHKAEHDDIAGALIAKLKPELNYGPPPSTGRFTEVTVEEAERI